MSIVEYTDFLVKSLVKDPDLVKVESFDSDDESKIIEIIVPSEDAKLIIGKNGKNAQALRTLIQAYAYIHNMKRVKINIDSF
jgi:hypothetical protein